MDTGKATGKPRLLIGVPAYRGTAYIAATLRSIQAQQFKTFHVLISVDNSDEETARACQPFLSDPRFRLVVQERHLNWDGNINWLMSREGYEFFCYWQQDDVATDDYLSSLVRFADDNPDFVCAFSDIELMGSERGSVICPSVTGFALTRAIYIFESTNWAAFRGLMRKEAIDRAGPIRRNEYESAWEDIIWLAKLAREGNMGRVQGPLYYKRRHGASISGKWMERESSWKRAVWLEFGVGMLETILPVVFPSEQEAALAVVLERLCCPREGRFRLYDPASDRAFAFEFLRIARQRCSVMPEEPALREVKDAEIVRNIFQFWHNRDAAIQPFVARSKAELRDRGKTALQFRTHDPAVCLLISGWWEPEDWGTWSDGLSAEVRLPVPAAEHGWRITITCRAYASPAHPQTILVHLNGAEQAWRFENFEIVEKEWLLAPLEGLDILSFRFPNATSPQALGQSSDNRMIGLGLINITVVRLDAQAERCGRLPQQ